MPRAFLALLLDDETRAAVSAQIDRLRTLCRAVAWVPADNLHITLKFLGQEPEARLELVRQTLARAVASTPAFAITLHGLGAFPGLERPRILWIGVADGALPARQLQSEVEAALELAGFDREARPWHPHLTVGRVFDVSRWRREAGLLLREAVAEAARRGYGSLSVGRIALMRSDLSPRGARYTELASVPLAGAS